MHKQKISIIKILLVVLFLLNAFSTVVYANDNFVYFGEYPQAKVKDVTTIDSLNKINAEKGAAVNYQGEKYQKKDDGSWYIYEPIKWRVLEQKGDQAFVISELILDSCGLSNTWNTVAWPNSIAREKLNSTFINMAFDNQEQSCIFTTNVETDRGGTTQDKIFYPSVRELSTAQYGFNDNNSRCAGTTEYANVNTYLTRDTMTVWFGYVYGVYAWSGDIKYVCSDAWWGMRPCMNINISKAVKITEQKMQEKEEAQKKDITNAVITLSKKSYQYDGKEKKPSITVKYNGKKLSSKNYTVKYSNNKYVGTATVKITGKGQYEGTVKKNFTIKNGKRISITFDGNGGIVSKKKMYVNAGCKFGTLPTVQYRGYKFLGWFTAKKGGKQVTKTSYVEGTKNQTLYAHWEKKLYSITYKLNGGTNDKNNPKSYTVSTKTFSLKNPTRQGYIFKGWYTDSNFKTVIKDVSKGTTGNKILYAKWEPIEYTIKFNSGGATSGKMSSISAKSGKEYTLSSNKYKKDGYQSVFWFIECIIGPVRHRECDRADGYQGPRPFRRSRREQHGRALRSFHTGGRQAYRWY